MRTMAVTVTAPHYHKVRYNSVTCADPESFVRGGLPLTGIFVDKGRKDPNTTISRPSRFAGVQMMPQH